MELSLVLVLALAVLHVLAGKMRLIDRIARRRWLSVSGGVAIAYVFLEILPDLVDAKEALARLRPPLLPPGMRLVFVIGLCGLVVFYGLELMALRARRRGARPAEAADGVFWVHIGAFAVYNALFSYLLEHSGDPLECSLLFVAVGLHYVANDHSLWEHHKGLYERFGRWTLAGAILLGWIAGRARAGEALMAGHEYALIPVVQAFLAGGVILNVLKGELPDGEDTSFASFVTGATAYSVLLLLA